MLFPESPVHGFVGTARGLAEPNPVPDVAALDPAVERVTFAGGSPLAHPAFWELATDSRLTNKILGVETPAAAVAEAGVLSRLKEAGIAELFVVTRGTDDLSVALESGLRVYVVLVAERRGLRALLSTADTLCGRAPRPHGLLVALARPRALAPEARARLLPPGAAAELSARVFDRARRAGMEYGFFDPRGVSPCQSGGALDAFGTVFHQRFRLLARQEEALVRVPACDGCSLADACGGLEPDVVETFGSAARPVPLETSMGWKLRPIHSLDRVDYKNASPFQTPGGRAPRTLLRVNGHCNMSCSFCFVDRTVPDFATAELSRTIEQMYRQGGRHLVLSGGEPTLHPDLPELLALGKRLGFDTIEIQTNGVRAADEAYARSLVQAGLTRATMSLHSVRAEESDRVTRLPGGFEKTVRAIDNFRALGISTQIAHVITKANYRELPQTVRWLAERFPESGGHLSLCLAIAQGISDLVYTWVVPTFTEIEPFVRAALDDCLEQGVGFGGMIGQGGYPPCMLRGDLRYYQAVLDQVFLSEDFSDQFYKAERCTACSFEPYCVGVRRSYVETHGDAELRPFRADVSELSRLKPVPASLVQLRTKDDLTRVAKEGTSAGS